MSHKHQFNSVVVFGQDEVEILNLYLEKLCSDPYSAVGCHQ